MGTSFLIAFSKILTMMLLNESYYSSWIYVPVLGIAMIFSAFSSFMGSVYFVEKRSVRSLVTASIGALLNVILNFIFIPIYGAMGAAVATAVSYVAVFLIRAYDSGRFLKFKLCVFKLIINSVVVVAQTVIMIYEIPFWIYCQIGMVAFLVAFNGRDIISAIREFISSFLKNKKKNI